MDAPSMLPQLADVTAGDTTRRRHAENRGRLAMCGERFETTGVGLQEFTKRVDFGMMFIRKPFFSYGAELDPDDVRDIFNLDQDDEIPSVQCSGYVTDWDTTTKGMYVGAWVAVSVWVDTTLLTTTPDASARGTAVQGDPNTLQVEHHCSFQEVALKIFQAGQDDGADATDADTGGGTVD